MSGNTSDTDLGRLGFIGLGVMGEAMASNLVRKVAQETLVFDLVQDPVDRLIALGATAVASVADVAAADIVFLSLPGIAQVEEVCDQLLTGDQLPRLIVDMSTSDVRRTRELAQRLAVREIQFVDAPVARMRQAAKDGTLLILVGATDAQFATLQPLLATMGTDVLHCGLAGSGQVVKILNNMVVAANVRALAEAVAIGRTAGVEPSLVRDLLGRGSADSFMLHGPAMTALVTDVFPQQAFPTAYMIKDIGLALTLAEEGGIRADLAKGTYELLTAARDAGYADDYYPVIIRAIEGRL